MLYLIILILLAVTQINGQGQLIPFTNAEIKLIVDGHNNFRSAVQPPATNMLPVEWNNGVANFAETYSLTCSGSSMLSHNPSRIINGTYAGENIYAYTAPITNVTWALLSWYNEYKYYDYFTNRCESGKVCGHYTQLVWQNPNAGVRHKIGCARVKCDNHFYKYNLLCDYWPGGNYVGDKPYKTNAVAATTTASPAKSPTADEKSYGGTNSSIGDSAVGLSEVSQGNASSSNYFMLWQLVLVLLMQAVFLV
ncbi:cysteine-rich protein [Acrasis kona]|uniref:Cysteine-rich protein n=1 Tax=Acrasis kona TaxID=1008807 RepID=A0AAW2YMC1_9EUKA